MVDFCAATLILKMEEKTQYFWWIILYYFKKIKMKKKDLCSVWRWCCDWSNMSKVVCEVSWYYWHFWQIILCYGVVIHIGRCLAGPLDSIPRSQYWEPNILKISKSMKLLVKWKMCFFILQKKLYGLFGLSNILSQSVSVSQEFRNCIAGWFELRIFHEDAAKLLFGATTF